MSSISRSRVKSAWRLISYGSVRGPSALLRIICSLVVILWASQNAVAAPRVTLLSPNQLRVANLGDGLRAGISWHDRSQHEQGFRIQRQRLAPLGRIVTRTVRANSTLLIDRPGPGRFRYRALAFNQRGASRFSSWVSVVIESNSSTPTPAAEVTPAPTATPTPFIQGLHECNDGIDNDNDGNIDLADGGCFGPNQRETTSASDGWTRFNKSNDTRIIYVSASIGLDCADCGYSPDTPVRSIAKGESLLRDGYPDWLLLKRGDTWVGETIGNSGGGWTKSGRSTSERMVIGGYGSGDRPKILITNEATGFSQTHPISHVALVGIHLEAADRKWYEAPSGIRMIGRADDVLYEDLFVKGFATNVIVQSSGTDIESNISLRRNIIVDAWSATSHSQGIFSSAVDGLLIEENVFDHNGWRDGACRATLTSATWNASQRLLTQTGAFTSATHPELWANGGEIEISGGLFTTGAIANPSSTATGTVFRGDSSLSALDDYYTGKFLKFTSGANPGNPRTDRFQRIVHYTGATREFTVTRTGDEFSPPSDGDTFRIDVMGLFAIQERVSDNAIRLATSDLSPVDLNTGDLSSGAGAAATIFNRSMYLSGGSGHTITRRNIDSNGASGGIQQRKGGDAIENLFLRAPLALGLGHAQNNSGSVTGSIIGNVILDARDIESAPRGIGITVSGNGPYLGGPTVYADSVQVSENIVAHNSHGSGNLFAFELGNWTNNIEFQHNIAYDWASPSGSGFGFSKDAGTVVSNISIHDNDFQQPTSGSVLISYDAAFIPGLLQFTDNRYFTAGLASRAFYFSNGYHTAAQWGTAASDTSLVGQVSYSDPNRSIETYMGTLGLTASYEAFIDRARQLSKTNSDPKFYAIRVINYIRAGFDKAPRTE